MNELSCATLAIKEYIVSAIQENEELEPIAENGIWDSLAPRNTAQPYIVFQVINGGPAYTLGKAVYENIEIDIRIIGLQEQAGDIEDAREIIRDIFAVAPDLDEYTTGIGMRLRPIEQAEVIADNVVITRGDSYRFFIASI